MYISPLQRMKKIHIWIGTTSKSEEEFEKYFDQDNEISEFALDIGIEEYDEDFIGIIPIFSKTESIDTLLKEIPLKQHLYDTVVNKCKELGIINGNAILYLTDSQVEVALPFKNKYNDLKYIGIFESSL